ncbi:ANTAR domain-containing response regulator [Planctomycetes bacterium K23_9]|uniref:Putative transcriptional regulatory protein pdtaR n=1 Tax=Stieleria marina TaxID=1930275 RepID=A0A517NXU8_9BACT|nr:putative transcriptional regulatory protein pdtaR [Planctomycetes bacterium K23_9]
MSDPISKTRTIHFAHGDPGSRAIILTILQTLGHDVRLVTESGAELIAASITDPPELIIAAPRLSDMDGIEAMILIGESKPTAGIVVAKSGDLSKVERALEDHVMAYLVEPITAETIQPAIFLAEGRFDHFQKLDKKIDRLKNQLEDRKIIERAKGIVMKVRNLSEEEAHRYLQSCAAKSRKKLVELAETICAAGDVLQP